MPATKKNSVVSKKLEQQKSQARKQNLKVRSKSAIFVFGFYALYFLFLFFSNPLWFKPIEGHKEIQFVLQFMNLLMLVPIVYFVSKEITNLCFPKNKGVFIYTAISLFIQVMGSGLFLLLTYNGIITATTKLITNPFTFYLVIVLSGIVFFTIISIIVWSIISKKYHYVSKLTKVWFTLLTFIMHTFFVGWFYVTIIHEWTTFLFLIAISSFCDIFAYLGGTKFGKHKMAPVISPKKSWEGLIFGICITLLVMCGVYALGYIPGLESKYHSLYSFIGCQTCAMQDASGQWINLKGYFWAIYPLVTLAIMIMSVFGDLFFSFIKRKFNIKDFSNLLPGHGGILDRMDAIIFTFTFYFLITVILQLIMIACVNTNVLDKSHISGLYWLWRLEIPKL